MLSEIIILLRRLGLIALVLWAVVIILHFPHELDNTPDSRDTKISKFYNTAVQPSPDATKYQASFDATHEEAIREVSDFVKENRLQRKHTLEVGSGTGYLQDVVEDYTGLDIGAPNRKFYHKRFVVGSATAMPFSDNEFDTIWSLYVFGHVVDPERGLTEMRRVLKNGGLLFLKPAWNCTSWAAEGYEVRPFGDLDLKGKVIKASLSVRAAPLFQMSYRYPIRLLRVLDVDFRQAPSQLRYRRLEPNFVHYWVPDSDAVNSLDRFETLLWFLSRGDECLNCVGKDYWRMEGPLVLRLHKN